VFFWYSQSSSVCCGCAGQTSFHSIFTINICAWTS